MLRILFICACILLSANADYPFAEKDNIINLGEPTWDLAIGEFPKGLLVYFYEPFCSPCRTFEPEIIKAATGLKQKISHVRFAKVECHDEVKVCNAKNVYTFPTLQLYRKGSEPFEYRGPRTSDSIQSWVRKVVDHDFPVVDSAEKLFSRYSTALLVRQVTEDIKLAAQLVHDDVEIAIAGSGLQSVVGQDLAVLYTQNKQKVSIKSGDDEEDIQAKVVDLLDTQKSCASNLNAKIYGHIQDNNSHDFVIFFRTKKFASDSDATKAFDKAAKDLNQANVYFVYANAASDDLIGSTVANLFGVGPDDEPTVGVISKNKRVLRKYKLDSGAKVGYEEIKSLFENAKAGKGQRYYMSAKAPIENKRGDVKELIGTNYAQATKDTKKNVFVMLYYPWCEWCLKLEPAWNSLAYRFRDRDDIVIAKIDVSKNDVPGYEASEYPILLFYKAGASDPIEYLSKKNINNLRNFLFDNVPGLKDSFDL